MSKVFDNDQQVITFKSTPAVSLGIFDRDPKEMMCYLYLPIKLIDSSIIELEPRVQPFYGMVHAAIDDFNRDKLHVEDQTFSHYIYLTAKRLFVTPDNIGNRPGYHCDGFGTDDVNYIWCDKYPTIFNSGTLSVRNNDILALEDMDAQAIKANEYTHPVKSLVRIDSWCPHRTPTIEESGMRTFVKISISKHRYNLQGNSRNYALSYDWPLYERDLLRNIKNKDFQQEPLFQ